jgi:hypothetical protein
MLLRLDELILVSRSSLYLIPHFPYFFYVDVAKAAEDEVLAGPEQRIFMFKQVHCMVTCDSSSECKALPTLSSTLG